MKARWLFAGAALMAAPPAVMIGAVTVAFIAAGPGDDDGWSDLTVDPGTYTSRAGIPAVALDAYERAADTLNEKGPGWCRIGWWQIAAVHGQESGYGTHGGATAGPDGVVAPAIVGIVIGPDTDGGALDGDPVQDRAVGPGQILPGNWFGFERDFPDLLPPGSNPQSLYASAVATGIHLCTRPGGVDLVESFTTDQVEWRRAVRAYNDVDSYIDQVTARARQLVELGATVPVDVPALPADELVATVLQAAYTQLGVPYRYADARPGIGMDCSGLVWWAYRQAGIVLPRVTFDQIHVGTPVSYEQLEPGDLVFTWGGVPWLPNGHVSIYIGDGRVIVAPHTGDVVKISPVPSIDKVTELRRIV